MEILLHGSPAGIGAGLAAIAGGIGIGTIFAAAISGIARQPEQAKQIQTIMYIGAGLVEALALFGLVVSFMSLK